MIKLLVVSLKGGWIITTHFIFTAEIIQASMGMAKLIELYASLVMMMAVLQKKRLINGCKEKKSDFKWLTTGSTHRR